MPFVTICRSRFGDYKEYHTSDDNLNLISGKNLFDSLKCILEIVDEIQKGNIADGIADNIIAENEDDVAIVSEDGGAARVLPASAVNIKETFSKKKNTDANIISIDATTTIPTTTTAVTTDCGLTCCGY